jgi:putative resolvase
MKYLSIGEASLMLGITTKTLRRWDNQGKFKPEYRTLGKHRRYSINQLKLLIDPEYKIKNKLNVIYSRVSSHGQKKDLIKQEFNKDIDTDAITMVLVSYWLLNPLNHINGNLNS